MLIRPFLILLLLTLAPPAHAALTDKISTPTSPSAQPPTSEMIVLAGGCFWGVEAVFEHLKGVTNAVSGYAGGKSETAHYDQVSTGTTGHAEAVQITYDPKQITQEQILKVFFTVAHDPTQLNEQGPDKGTQYRSAIFTKSADQAKAATNVIKQLEDAKTFSQPIVTEVKPLETFYLAEDYHQNYLDQHMTQPYIVMHDLPKLAQLRIRYPELYVGK